MSYLRCSVRLYLQLFVRGCMSYLRYLCSFSSSFPPVVCERAHVLFTMFFSSLPPVVCERANVLLTISCSSFPPGVCEKAHV